ncbi:MAG: DUF4328 domain-containing protein [Solirubrobacteraceae bacterium]|nr:DUF4328 domain-containing protein [Solirubrobacteraceae bacterium]
MNASPTFLTLRGRSQVAVALLVVSALVCLLSILYELDVRGLLERLTTGQPVSYTELTTADDRTELVGILSIVALIATASAFIAWFHRAYTNIELLGARDLRASRGWSIGAWFVPILNLIRPKQLMDDIWRASDPAQPAKVESDWRMRPVPGLLHAWWALFLGGNALGNVAGRMIADAATPAARQSASTWALVSDGLLIAGAVAGILVVRAVTDRQERRAARVTGGGQPTAGAVATAGERPAGLENVTVWPPISA